MSLYMNTDKPAMGSRIRPTTSKDNIGGGAGLDKLNKRVVKNAKFANVKSTLDTGANAGNVKAKVDRSGEMFRRVNRRQLHQLMLACESGDESIYRLQDRWDSVEDNDDAASTRSGMSARSSSSSNASYASSASSSGTVIATHTSSTGSAPAAAAASCASDYFILLDVRDDESQFKAFHIEGSIHYPPSCLRRDYFPASLYRFKNAADKLIILVDSDETSRIGLECATLFLQKGFANIFVLTGGLKHFGIKYQDRIVGEALQPPLTNTQNRGGAMGSTAGAGGVSNRSQALAGMPASSRPFTGASAASSAAASARPGSSASARMQQQQQQQQHQFQQSSRPTSLNFGGATTAAAARPGATQLGGGGFGSSRFAPQQQEERESPRAALGRQQQQQQAQAGSSNSSSAAAPSHRSRLSNGAAAGAAGVSTGGHTQISSRAFR